MISSGGNDTYLPNLIQLKNSYIVEYEKNEIEANDLLKTGDPSLLTRASELKRHSADLFNAIGQLNGAIAQAQQRERSILTSTADAKNKADIAITTKTQAVISAKQIELFETMIKDEYEAIIAQAKAKAISDYEKAQAEKNLMKLQQALTEMKSNNSALNRLKQRNIQGSTQIPDVSNNTEAFLKNKEAFSNMLKVEFEKKVAKLKDQALSQIERNDLEKETMEISTTLQEISKMKEALKTLSPSDRRISKQDITEIPQSEFGLIQPNSERARNEASAKNIEQRITLILSEIEAKRKVVDEAIRSGNPISSQLQTQYSELTSVLTTLTAQKQALANRPLQPVAELPSSKLKIAETPDIQTITNYVVEPTDSADLMNILDNYKQAAVIGSSVPGLYGSTSEIEHKIKRVQLDMSGLYGVPSNLRSRVNESEEFLDEVVQQASSNQASTNRVSSSSQLTTSQGTKNSTSQGVKRNTVQALLGPVIVKNKDKKAKKIGKQRLWISIIDEDDSYETAVRNSDWVSWVFHRTAGIDIFILLRPMPQYGEVGLPTGWDGSFFEVSRNNQSGTPRTNYAELLKGFFDPLPTNVRIAIDNSGSMTRATVALDVNEFEQYLQSENIPWQERNMNDELWIRYHDYV